MTDQTGRGRDSRPVWNPLDVDPILDRFYGFVDSLDSKKRKLYLFGWLGIAVALCVAASIPLPQGFRWVSATIGFPAGVILFLAGLALVYTTRLGDSPVFRLKESFPPTQRVVMVVIGTIVFAALLFMANPWMPFGVGGALVVAAVLAAFMTLRRSPEELELARQGIPDPREVKITDEEED